MFFFKKYQKLHKIKYTQYGLDYDNYIGLNKQYNIFNNFNMLPALLEVRIRLVRPVLVPSRACPPSLGHARIGGHADSPSTSYPQYCGDLP